MKKIRIVIAVVLSLLFMLSLCSCKVEMIDNNTTSGTTTASSEEHDDWGNYSEYNVTDYEVEDGAFEISGDINLYKYDSLPDAENVINVFNSYYDMDLKVDESTHYDDGYGNWFWESSDSSKKGSASVSMSSKTGKFSFYYAPDEKIIVGASMIDEVEKDKWTEKVTDFVNQFEFVTGKLVLKHNVVYNDLYYPYLAEGQDDSQDLQVKGRRYFFVSEEYSKQTVDAQNGVECYVECGNSDIADRDIQYFVVTIFNDGTIVTADNNITKAAIIPDGTQKMIDESDMEKVVAFFSSTTENDTFILKRAYIKSYGNYFGRPGISPTVTVEYCFKSNPKNVMTTEIDLGGFSD